MSAIVGVSVKRVVTTAGTAVKLFASSTLFVSAVIQALDINTGSVYIGNLSDDVTDHNSAAAGIALAAGETLTLSNMVQHGSQLNFDGSNYWIDSAVSGEGVAILYFTNTRNPGA
jgi:hypothetical protein